MTIIKTAAGSYSAAVMYIKNNSSCDVVRKNKPPELTSPGAVLLAELCH